MKAGHDYHLAETSRNWKETVDGAPAYYAYCRACDWIGPSRGTKAAAEDDAAAHDVAENT